MVDFTLEYRSFPTLYFFYTPPFPHPSSSTQFHCLPLRTNPLPTHIRNMHLQQTHSLRTSFPTALHLTTSALTINNTYTIKPPPQFAALVPNNTEYICVVEREGNVAVINGREGIRKARGEVNQVKQGNKRRLYKEKRKAR